MSYNWEEIFKNKTNKELYEIYKGHSHLPEGVQQFAEKELQNRNFDFQDLEMQKAAWRLTDLMEQENYENNGLTGRQLYFISYKYYILIQIAVILFIVFFTDFNSLVLGQQISRLAIFISISSLLILINNFFYRRNQIKQEKRRNEIEELANKLDENDLLKKDSPILKEIVRERKKEIDGLKVYYKVSVIIGILLFLSYIYKILSN